MAQPPRMLSPRMLPILVGVVTIAIVTLWELSREVTTSPAGRVGVTLAVIVISALVARVTIPRDDREPRSDLGDRSGRHPGDEPRDQGDRLA